MAEQNLTSGSLMSMGPGEAVGHWSMYRWIPVAGSFVMFGWACMIGANDVATSFGTSIGSGVLTMLQAVLLALVMEISGALSSGSRLVDPLHTQVLKEGPPTEALLMWGLLISLIAATIWLALATHWELPVTSSLTLWGALIGISLTTQGMHGVYWIEPDSPIYVGGILGILVSWFLAPLLAGVTTFLFYGSMKIILLRAEEVEKRALRALPFYYGITVTVLIFFILYEATPVTTLEELGKQKGGLIAGFSGVLAVILAYLLVIPLLQKRLGCFIAAKEQSLASQMKDCPEREDDAKVDEPSSPALAATKEMSPDDYFQQFNDLRCLDTVHEGDEEACQSGYLSSMPSMKCSPLAERISFAQLLARTPSRVLTFKRLRTLSRKQTSQTTPTKTKGHKTMRLVAFQQNMEHDGNTQVMHTHAEKFDDKVEELFSFLCILTACVTAFSHGANDIAIATRPYAQILQIYNSGNSLPDRATERWILAYGATVVCIGFAVLGWRLVRCLGGRLTFLSPSRAFSVQLCALSTFLLASQSKIPSSMTHILIGALVGVGLTDNIRNVNWRLLSIFLMGWVGTLLFTCGLSSALFSVTIFSPAYSVV
ncbi:hypothetical protein Mapa_006610 [Marchantia paleacea]|nr:hypothetical protein Mapa_006610 [Marchantia paleacea]